MRGFKLQLPNHYILHMRSASVSVIFLSKDGFAEEFYNYAIPLNHFKPFINFPRFLRWDTIRRVSEYASQIFLFVSVFTGFPMQVFLKLSQPLTDLIGFQFLHSLVRRVVTSCF